MGAARRSSLRKCPSARGETVSILILRQFLSPYILHRARLYPIPPALQCRSPQHQHRTMTTTAIPPTRVLQHQVYATENPVTILVMRLMARSGSIGQRRRQIERLLTSKSPTVPCLPSMPPSRKQRASKPRRSATSAASFVKRGSFCPLAPTAP